MNESCQGILFYDVLDLLPAERSCLIRLGQAPWCKKISLGNNWTRFQFEAIKWVKKKKAPDDRFWESEIKTQQGSVDFIKMDALIESRKTRAEKEAEKSERNEMNKQYIKLGLEPLDWGD